MIKNLKDLYNLLGDLDISLGDTDCGELIFVCDDIESSEILEYKIAESGEDFIRNMIGGEYFIGYRDEWYYCGECGKWVQGYHVLDSDVICYSCVNKKPFEYLYEFINNPKKAYTELPKDLLDVDYMSSYSEEPFKKCTTIYEYGLYDDQQDPKDTLKELLKEYKEVVFYISHSDPFCTQYKALVR